jgi:RND family efflux transporter MFP subunit
VLAAAGLSAALLAGATGCRQDAKASSAINPGDPARRVVRTAQAARVPLARTVEVTGTLAAEDQADVGMKVPGRVASLPVDLGSRVSRGDPLAVLIQTDYELRVRQAEAALQQARARLGLAADSEEDRVDAEHTSLVRQARAVLDEAGLTRDRARRLSEEQLISKADLDAAEAAYQVADARYNDALEEIVNRQAVLAQRRSELDLARQQLTDTVLKAPFDGAVRERHVALGQYVATGQPVVTLVRVHPLRLRLAVPERVSAGIRPGLDVRVTVDGDAGERHGQVARLSPALDEGNRTLMVEAVVPNEDGALRPGSFARAEIVTVAEEPSLVVPASALITFAGIQKVILVQDGKAVERRVILGRRVGDQVEILEGLKAGDPVVLEPGNLAGGQAVDVAG